MRLLGIDLAWGEGSEVKQANRSGVVALDQRGRILDAGWTIGIDATLEWIEAQATRDTMLFVDAPLVITNLTKQRLADKQVGQRYGSSWVSANSVNIASKRKAGVSLRDALEKRDWRYDDGQAGPARSGKTVSECYPYTTIVGAEELGYEEKRPAYKRKPKKMTTAEVPPTATQDVRRADRARGRTPRRRSANGPHVPSPDSGTGGRALTREA